MSAICCHPSKIPARLSPPYKYFSRSGLSSSIQPSIQSLVIFLFFSLFKLCIVFWFALWCSCRPKSEKKNFQCRLYALLLINGDAQYFYVIKMYTCLIVMRVWSDTQYKHDFGSCSNVRHNENIKNIYIIFNL